MSEDEAVQSAAGAADTEPDSDAKATDTDGPVEGDDDPAPDPEASEADAPESEAAHRDAPPGAWDRVRAVLPLLPKIASWAIAAAAAVAFGYSFGFNYGVNNQVVYLLGALNLVKPELYKNDWLVQHTTHYHPVYEWLCGALLAIDHSGWPVAIALTVVVAAGSLCLYWMMGSILRRGALPAYILLLTILRITATRGIAVSYIFDYILQPSTLGACGTIFAIAFFLRGKHLASGVALAIGGLCHANYLLLGGLVFGLAQLFLGGRGIVKRSLRQLGPPTVALLLMSPLIFKAAVSAHAEQARDIYFNIRAPHHFDPTHFRGDFTSFVAWHLLGLGLGLPLMRKAQGLPRRYAAVTGGLLTVVWLGALLTTAYKVPQVTNLFPWRFSPFVLLMLQVAVCASAVRLFLEPSYRKKFTPVHIGLTVAGLGYFAVLWAMSKPEPLWNLALAIVGLGAVGFTIGLAIDGARRLSKLQPIVRKLDHPVFHTAVGLGLLVWSGAVWDQVYPKALKLVEPQSILTRGFDPGLTRLYDWMHENTSVDAVFLTPPGEETMRYRGERAVIVDWKSPPIVPDELIEWYHRLQDVTGRPNFRSSRDLGGYDSLDLRRLQALKKKYRIDYVVVSRGRERLLPGLPVLFGAGRYVILDARGVGAS